MVYLYPCSLGYRSSHRPRDSTSGGGVTPLGLTEALRVSGRALGAHITSPDGLTEVSPDPGPTRVAMYTLAPVASHDGSTEAGLAHPPRRS
jgi:hypothetical protein